MLKYPSVESTKGKHAKILIADEQHSKRTWYNRIIKTSTFSRFFGSKDYLTDRSSLRLLEFMRIAFYWQLPLLHYIFYINIVIFFGGDLGERVILNSLKHLDSRVGLSQYKTQNNNFYLTLVMVFFANVILSILIGIPLLMLLLFLGHYTKRGYIKIWEIYPILKGTAFSVCMFSILLEFCNVSIAGLALVFIVNIFNFEVNWSDCKFDGASNNCYPMYPTKVYKEKCCLETYGSNCTVEDWRKKIWFATFDYLINGVLKAPDRYSQLYGLGEIQPSWLGYVFLTWLLIFCLMSAGFRRYHNFMSAIASFILSSFFILMIGTILYFSFVYGQPILGTFQPSVISKADFWVSVFGLVIFPQIPGNYILLGAMAPQSMLPTTDAVIIYSFKFLLQSMVIIWVSLCLEIIREHYRIEDIACVPVNGLAFLLAAVPDILTRLPASRVLLFLWYLCVWFIGFSTALYTMTALLESLIESFPWIVKIRYYFCAAVCLVCFILNMTTTTNFFYQILTIFRKRVIVTSCPITIITLGIAILGYTVNRIAGDFYFTYRKPLGKYWIHTLKLMCFFVTGMFFVVVTNIKLHQASYHQSSSIAVIIMWHILDAILLSPIIIVAIIIYLRYKNKHNIKMVITPTSYWGPPTIAKKDSRKKFNPTRELQYNSEDQTCKHNCLIGSKKLLAEIQATELRRRHFFKIVGIDIKHLD